MEELARYLAWLSSMAEVIVVDGSPPELFAGHRRALDGRITHLPVDPDLPGRYGKVNGVMTGLRAAGHDLVVVADDDVRWDGDGLERAFRLLDGADLVRPQNYFDPRPWHARWDTARTLLNRSWGHDYPGTLALRRSTLLAAGGYDGDALFENLELIRTVEAAGGTVANRRDLYVRRLPSSPAHFWSQRVRQAYDDFALPARLAGELALLPAAALLVARRRMAALGLAAAVAVGLAEVGRRREGGTAVFPASSSLLAPVWLGERAVCTWLALWCRLRHGGVRYAGTTLSKAASSRRALRLRLASPAFSPAGTPRCSTRSRP